MFKKSIMMITAAVFSAGIAQASVSEDIAAVARVRAQAMGALVRAVNVASEKNLALDWQVGEYHDHQITFAFGNGESHKEVTKDVPADNAFWLVNDMTLMGQTQKSEALISRADGKVLRLIINGEEQDPDNGGGEAEIIEQYESTVTVPAGSFDCWYVKVRSKDENGQTQDMEVWINPVDVNLDGMLKIVAQTQFGPLTLEMTAFGKK